MKCIFTVFALCSLLFSQVETGEKFYSFGENSESAPPPLEEGIDLFSNTPAIPKELTITNNGRIEYREDQEEVLYDEKVEVVTDSGLIMYADEAVINLKEEKVTMTGNVSVYNGPFLSKGEQTTFYYTEKRLVADSLRTGYDPFLLEARSLRNVEKDGKQVLIAEGASVTTDDYEDPSFWLRADRVALHPNELVVFNDLKVEVGGKTIFWFPYLAQSLNADLGYHFTPGATNTLGFFWKNRYGLYLGGEEDEETGRINDPSYLLQINVDPYSRRGVGLGFDLEEIAYKDDPQLGKYSAYWIHDFNPDIQRSGEERTNKVENSRFRLKVQDRREFGEVLGGELRLDSNLQLLSDDFVLQDYFETEHRVVPQPENTIALSHVKGNILSTLRTRISLNSFYETDQRLPEFALDRVRGPIFGSNILYESQSSVGFLRESLADQEIFDLQSESLSASPTRLEEIQDTLAENGFFRAHTWHELSSPYFFNNGISLTPRAGVGYTYYNDEEGGLNDGRALSFVGLDFALKFSRNYSKITNESLGLDGLNHIIQGYASLSHLDVSSLDGSFTEVDSLTPVTRPRPINVGRVTAIDALDDWSIVRAGLRQTILTRRNGSHTQWLYADTYIDVLLDNSNENQLSNLYNEISWTPLPWLTLNLEAQFPIADSAANFSEIFSGAKFTVGKSTEIEVGVSFLENHPIVQDSDQIRYSAFHRFNDEWAAGLEHRWQFDDGTLELQRYSLNRSMKSWIFSGEIFSRDFRVDQEWGFSVGLTLRDFPDISLPVSIQR